MLKKDVYNLTTPQKNIWNIEQYYKDTSINNICGSLLIKENIDLSILAKAINKFIENNDSFKTRIKLINGSPYQYFIDDKTYTFETINFQNIEELKAYSQKVANTPFEVIESQLFDFKLFKLSNGFGGFIINAHHIISDAGTFGMVGTEIVSNYSKIKNNQEIIKKEYSYISYIESEKNYLSSLRYEKDKEYWNEQYSSLPSIATIPSFKKEPDSSKANRLEFAFDQNIFNNINLFCKENKISVYNFLMAIYSIYIGRINNTEIFSLGTPVLNRSNFAEKHTSGMFISTSLLKINMENNPNFYDFVQNIAKASMLMLKHQKYDYQYILDDVRKKYSNIPNLYDIALSYQVTKANDTSSEIPYSIKWYLTPHISNSMNIHFHDNNDTGNLLIEYDYQICKYDKKDIIDMHNRIIYIMQQIINNPNIFLNDIEIITEKEKNTILNKFNHNTSNKNNTNLIDLFEKQVKKTPDKTAVIFEDKKITYKTLNEKANILANYLIDLGIKSNDIICISLNRSIELIIAIYAVIKSGASYLLIDTAIPKERINYIIKDSKSEYCIFNNLSKDLIQINKPINIDTFNFAQNNKNTSPNNHSDNLCVIYTSGSTGNPKGVLLHKHGFVNLISAFDKEMEISKYENILGIATVSFDMFAVELFCSTLLGNTLVLANEEEQNNPVAMSNLIKNNNVQFFITTPTRIELLLNKHNNPLKNIKAFQLGGEKFTTNLYTKLQKYTNAKMFNGYGPTEITACCTNKLVTSGNITIGKPISNVQVYICDSNLKLLPIGVIGEICVSGQGISNGYLNKPKANAKSFIKNPFGNGFLYKTGDLGRFNFDGEIEYIGRSDNQIKLRGLRIELEEIENKINSFAYINSCIVVKKEGPQSHEFLCAYYTANTAIEPVTIRKQLEEIVPKYMVPNFFIQLDSLPFTANGKIDKNNLPEPEYKSTNLEIVLPRNEIDSKLIELFKKLLGIDSISIDDDFFNLGGDSLSAINMCVYIQNELNVQISVKDILEHPVLKDLSDVISEKNKNTKKIIIKPVKEAEFYNVSSAQKRIFFASKVANASSLLYNSPGGIILDGDVDTEKLEQCFQILIDRHESFRTYFELKNETVVQKIIKNYNFKLNIIDNADFKNIDNIFKEFVKPFDLSHAPLFRAQFIKFTNDKSALFLDIHHIISDGVSMNIFTDELCKLYNDEKLPKIDITYKDFAEFENNMLTSKNLKDAEQYWLNQFKDEIPMLNFPTNYLRPAVKNFEGKKVYSTINSDTTKQIEELSKDLKITPYMILLSCYYILLSKYTSQEDIIIGSPIVNRNSILHYSLIGMFVNILALKNKVDNNLTFRDFVFKVKENLLEAYKYQDYPFDELVNKLNIKRDTSRNPLFDMMFAFRNSGLWKIDFNNVKTEYYIPDVNIAKFDLSLEVIPSDTDMKLSFEYSTQLFKEEFIKNLSIHYTNILTSILKNIDIKISDIEMLSVDEHNKFLYDFNKPSKNNFKNTTMVNLFEKQVEKNPNNIAVIFEKKKITYKELNEKANSLANYLLNQGVKENDIVCISLNRSIELIIAIYAVIKSGASYIIMDSSLPKERLNYMINDSESKYCILNNLYKDSIVVDNIINIDTFDFTKYDNKNISSKNNSDNLCIIYTSGSTGKPKGVLLHKHGFVNLVLAFDKEIEISKYKSFLGLANVSFDMFVFTLFNATLLGNTFVLANEEEQKNPVSISKLIHENNVEFLVTTPSMIELLFSEGTDNPLSNIKGFVLGGEAFPNTLYTRLKNVTDGKIYNGYGPTEITACCSIKQITSDDNITIGKPIPNTQIYICDSNMNLLPVGVVGEICVSGYGIANGYLNNKEATKNSFIKNPFGNGLLYKTGDLGKFNSDGEIEYIGRLDDQVKIRGLRIELGEIESLIQKYPNIKKSTVLKQNINNREFISAYFTASKPIVINDLRKYLSTFLPRYMIPTYFIALDDMPYTHNGKIDKKSLPLPKEILNISKEIYVSPKTDIQKKLVLIWEKILDTKPIGINDNFFELGGDSLLAMNLNVELSKISKNITYQDIFRYPTIAELEEKINSKNNTPFFNKIENLSDNITNILANNTKNAKIKKYHPKNILITGATGFLGIHILSEFIEHEKGNVYCIVREGKGITSKTRLYQKLNYYFKDKYTDLIDKRIFAVTGNITEPGFGLNQEDLLNIANSIDLVINCAANVSHYGNYNSFYNTNVKSVKHIIDFCKNFNKKLYHISTISVADAKLDLSYPTLHKHKNIVFDESCLYVGQTLENLYTRTKFEAEALVLSAISTGLNAYILRMGNLMPRLKDGLFQENMSDNDFINKVSTFTKLKIMPDYLLDYPINFTPIDQASKAIYKLITNTNSTNRIFHLYNDKNVPVPKLLKILKKYNYNIEVLPEKDFKKKVQMIMDDDKTKYLINNLINNFDNDLHLDFKTDIIIKSNFTIKYLRKIFFRWPRISNMYLIRFIRLLRKEL